MNRIDDSSGDIICTVEVVDRRRKLIALRDEYGELILRRLTDKDFEREDEDNTEI